jgi:hypothetical protein
MGKSKIPVPQIVYGRCIYWLCITAAVICTIGPVIAVAFPDKNLMNPHYLFPAIWEGKSPEMIWQEVGKGFPGGYFWLHNLNTGDGFTQFGIVLSCSCASVALIATAITFLRQKPRPYRWVLLSFGIALLIVLSALGIWQA